MALSRRTGARFQGSIWPGFVDAMTGLLLVLMFVLTIFMVLQAVQTQRINGQENELNSLSGEVAALAQALGMERQTTAELEAELGTLNTSLTAARDQAAEQAAMIASLTATRDAQAAQLDAAEAKITGFEAQVASLLSQRDAAVARGEALETRQEELLSAQEALNLALAQARSETDAQAEAARLAAARRDALTALVDDLRAQNQDAQAALETAAAQNAAALSEAEAARLAEAAAAERLREKLENADAELTAMTLALEAQRKEAEDTLTLLAAARAAKETLDAELAAALAETETLEATQADRAELRAKLADALAAKLAAENRAEAELSDAEKQAALLDAARSELAQEEAATAAAQRQTELLNQQVAALRGQLGELQSLLDDAVARDAAKEVQLQSLGSDLNTALARVAAEERRRAVFADARKGREDTSNNTGPSSLAVCARFWAIRRVCASRGTVSSSLPRCCSPRGPPRCPPMVAEKSPRSPVSYATSQPISRLKSTGSFA